VSARWFDPTDGSFVTAPGEAQGGKQSFTPPPQNAAGDGDWVLVLEAGEREGKKAP
jgi:hypothetical protein